VRDAGQIVGIEPDKEEKAGSNNKHDYFIDFNHRKFLLLWLYDLPFCKRIDLGKHKYHNCH
jgi:hypothetical protein